MQAYLKDLFRRKGIRGFYQGMYTSLVKVIPYNSFVFLFNDWFKLLMKYEK